MLSVIIPTYNRKETLKESLQSLFNQSLSKDQYEILVIDDGSTDITQAVLSEMSRQSPVKLKYFYQQNKGPGAARNLGIRQAQGELIFITGDDIIATDNLLKEHLDSHKIHRGIAVLGKTEWHPDIELTEIMNYISQSGHQFEYKKISDPFNLPYNYFYTSNISLPKSWFEQVGYFDEEFPYASFEDTELGYRMSQKGLRIIYNERALAYHKHRIELMNFCERQRKAGESGYIFYLKHPELAKTLRIDRNDMMRNLKMLYFRTLSAIFKFLRFKRAYYYALLKYYYRLGVKQRMTMGRS